MSISFNIVLPKFTVDHSKRDFFLSFSILSKVNMPKEVLVIDYWSISNSKGDCKKEEPIIDSSYISIEKYGKKIFLVIHDDTFRLMHEDLDVCIHFLTQSGQSIEIHYTYKDDINQFSLKQRIEKPMSDREKYSMFDILKKATEFEKNNARFNTSRNPEGNIKKENAGFDSGYISEITDFIKAINREMYFLKGNGGRKYKITNGQFVMQSQASYVYSFDLEAELYLAEDSPVTVTVGLDSIPGVVLVCENFQVILALEKIPYSDKILKIPKAEISAEPWKLLEKLSERLVLINGSHQIALKLLKDGPKLATSGPLSSIVRGQEFAYHHALDNPIAVIWGPPGTGKTYTMAKIASAFLSQGKSVLIVSHSNVSVDNVAKQIYNQLKGSPLSALLERSKILRYGYVRDEELQKNDCITSFKVVMKNSPDKQAFDQLQEEYKKLTIEAETSNNTEIQQKILRINQSIKTIKAKHKDIEKDLVKKARLVATTVSKIYADSLFEDATYDVVMFDEISMAYVAQIVAAASFAKKHLICVGDFRQLSPIVQEKNAKAVLGRDLFEYLNISKGFRDINPHPWLVMLDEQRRMHPAISDFPSKYIYNGLLKNHESMLSKRKAIAEAAPFNRPMCLIDLYGTCCFGSKNEDNSRFNILSAVFAFHTALKAEKSQTQFKDFSNEEKVGIILNDKCVENEELEFLLSPLSKKLKQIYFSVAESISEAIDIIDTAQENDYSLTKKHIVYLSVYCKDPYCDFEEFLQQVERFEELNGNDFEEYWNLIYSFGFSPEDAVKDFYDSLEAGTDIIKFDEPDDMFERWAEEETDYANHDRMDACYDEDNPYYSNDDEDEDGISYTEE